ncbi:MAG: tyrosine--tRNA ligase [Candidatus Berkelbacteria bacterium]|nr:tyrosine--tRNA ligase [Candidatus Berkelbacteria bacterium]
MIEADFFTKGVLEIIDEKSFKQKLASGKKLRIKYGVDPTRPDIHLGHSVVMWKLRQLQDAGHTVIFLIGDYTTKIGDPSGRSTTRPMLSDEEIKKNAETYFDQVGKILDLEKAEIRYNSEWFSKMAFNDILQIAAKFTVAQIIERDDFEKRLEAGVDVGLHETLYPLMQAYDSVILKADVAFCGGDQKFNELTGRDLQKKMGQFPQDVLMVKLLVGLDGKIKMSKSADNYIGIAEPANMMFGKIMSIPDDVIIEYFMLATPLKNDEISEIQEELSAGKNPRDIKMRLGFEIVKLYHGEEAAREAEGEFVNVFSKKELPSEIPLVEIEPARYNLPILLIELGAALTIGEARRLIEQGGVKIDEERVLDSKALIDVKSGMLIQVGKKKYFRIK